MAWRPEMTFPGVAPGERLSRRTELAPRADLLARDGQPLAQGTERASVTSEVAAQVVGAAGADPTRAAPDELRRARTARQRAGRASQAWSACSNDRLAGRPGGSCSRAGGSWAARACGQGARSGPRSTPSWRRRPSAPWPGAAGGVAVAEPRRRRGAGAGRGGLLGLRPPGSTFKIVTTTAALEEGAVKLSDEFPVQTAAVLEGVELENANGESAAARSPILHPLVQLGVRPAGREAGRRRLVQEAERYGFNRQPRIDGAATRRSRPPTRSATTWRSGQRRSARGRCRRRAGDGVRGGHDRQPRAGARADAGAGARAAPAPGSPRPRSPPRCAG